ncbi:MAG: hypothetical protein PUP90_02345 [Nostoc sp. S4]|nr:hypothetical protein [Nostoc sp. S4]
MPITNDRRNYDRQKDNQRNSEDVTSRLGSSEGESISARNEPDRVFYTDSEGRNQAGTRFTSGGQATLGGIFRRLKELHEKCLAVIESQEKQIESSLHENKQLTAEIQDLYTLLAETLQEDSSNSE